MQSVEQLYSTYGKRVFNLACRMTGDRSTAEDIVQEVFARVVEHGDSFRGESSIYSWIFAIAKNECRRVRRRTFQEFEKLLETEARPARRGFPDELERRYYIREVKDGCLIGLLKCLPFQQRVAFILSALYRVPYKSVSRILGRSENSVRILVSRARGNLRAFLCKNCSHYDRVNRCACENMIEFSLKRGLIAEYRSGSSTRRVESELKELKNELLMYRTLSEQEPPPHLLREILQQKHMLILSKKRVK